MILACESSRGKGGGGRCGEFGKEEGSCGSMRNHVSIVTLSLVTVTIKWVTLAAY